MRSPLTLSQSNRVGSRKFSRSKAGHVCPACWILDRTLPKGPLFFPYFWLSLYCSQRHEISSFVELQSKVSTMMEKVNAEIFMAHSESLNRLPADMILKEPFYIAVWARKCEARRLRRTQPDRPSRRNHLRQLYWRLRQRCMSLDETILR